MHSHNHQQPVSSQPTDAFEKSIEKTLLAVETAPKGSLLIVDLDETLFLRNSSQAYLDCLYPQILGLMLLVGIKWLRPWRLLPAPFNSQLVVKDWCLMVIGTLLFPWTWFIWRSRARQLAETYCNQPLAEAIEASEASLVIATRGFSWIVKPLIQHLPIASVRNGSYRLIACRFWLGAADRSQSKLSLVRQLFDQPSLMRATVITDSAIDWQILSASATPCLVQWPEASFVPAMSTIRQRIQRVRAKQNKLSR